MHSLRLRMQNVTYGNEASDEIWSEVSKILIHQIRNPETQICSPGGSSKQRHVSLEPAAEPAAEPAGTEPQQQRGTPC